MQGHHSQIKCNDAGFNANAAQFNDDDVEINAKADDFPVILTKPA